MTHAKLAWVIFCSSCSPRSRLRFAKLAQLLVDDLPALRMRRIGDPRLEPKLAVDPYCWEPPIVSQEIDSAMACRRGIAQNCETGDRSQAMAMVRGVDRHPTELGHGR